MNRFPRHREVWKYLKNKGLSLLSQIGAHLDSEPNSIKYYIMFSPCFFLSPCPNQCFTALSARQTAAAKDLHLMGLCNPEPRVRKARSRLTIAEKFQIVDKVRNGEFHVTRW